MKLIVGLGNIGLNYANTLHNLGFLALDQIASILNLNIKKSECNSLTAKNEFVILAKPQTYMNLSGIAVKSLINYYKIPLNDLLVIYDDIDIEKGSIRVRQRGSGGTHNGIKNIIDELKSVEFSRIRIGVGKPLEYMNLADYVLSNIKASDKQIFNLAIENATNEALKWANLE